MNNKILYISILLILLGCSKDDSVETPISEQERFINAMIDASRDLTEEDIYNGLVPIKYGESTLTEWMIVGEDTLVLVSTMQEHDWYYADVEVGDSFVTSSTSDYPIWVTIPGELNSVLLSETKQPDSLSLNTRLKELIGLRPDGEESIINLLWINKNDLLRPSYNPDPTTTYGAVEYPSILSPGWYQSWFESNVDYSYESPAHGLNYPFTRLGYTYDWGENRSKYGLSEFITMPSSTMTLQEQMGCWSYYNQLY